LKRGAPRRKEQAGRYSHNERWGCGWQREGGCPGTRGLIASTAARRAQETVDKLFSEGLGVDRDEEEEEEERERGRGRKKKTERERE
jgi:hypothetical protein